MTVTYRDEDDALHELVIVQQNSVGVNVTGVKVVGDSLGAVEQGIVQYFHEDRRMALESSKNKFKSVRDEQFKK